MKKKLPYLLSWTLLLALFHVIVFATPNEIGGESKFGGGFWTGYAFTLAAFLLQLLCAWYAFRAGDRRKLFYRIPAVLIGYAVLGVTAAAGIVFMSVPQIPAWIAAVVCSVLTAFGAVAMLKAKAAAETVADTDKKIAAQTAFIKGLTARAETVLENAPPACKQEAKRVFEALKYSDPMSGDALNGIEGKIAEAFDAFEKTTGARAAFDAGGVGMTRSMKSAGLWLSYRAVGECIPSVDIGLRLRGFSPPYGGRNDTVTPPSDFVLRDISLPYFAPEISPRATLGRNDNGRSCCLRCGRAT